ncbi:MAG: hypothetical protein AAF926_05550 [Pseudomonadota bacterium]
MEVQIPNNWEPRDYQRPLWDYFENGGRYAAVAWHRRAGKDDVLLRLASTWVIDDPATYWHCLPEYAQARKAIWEAINPHTGKRRIDEAFPHEIRDATRENEMFIRFKTGATWQLVGSDSYDKLVGSPPKGIVFSEYALADPAVWAYARPILAENGGRAAFISTFRGRNHFHGLVERAKVSDHWFGEILPATQTSVFSDETLATEEQEYIDEYGRDEGRALYRQEYLCDPAASVPGAYYGTEMMKAEESGRLDSVPYDPGLPVFTGWDLGSNDQTAIWFVQVKGLSVRLIDYHAERNQKLPHYAQVCRDKGYNYGGHFLPHDGANETVLGNAASKQLEDAGLTNIRIIPRAKDQDAVLGDINTARRMIDMATFDLKACELGIDALRNYRREWDDRLKTFKSRPLHDWASDGADAFRTLAVAWNGDLMTVKKPEALVLPNYGSGI